MIPSRDAQQEFLNQPLARIGMFVIIIPNVFCTLEMVPGWGFGLHISHALLFVIAIAAGVIGGALMGGRYFLAGIVGGGLASLGALLAQTTYLAMVDSTWNILLALLMVIGAAPGAIVGYNLARLQIRLAARADLPKGPPDDPDNPYRQP